MNESDAQKLIREWTHVTRQQVVIAKGIIARESGSQSLTSALVDAVLKGNSATIPQKIILHPSVDPTPALKGASVGLSWFLAAKEAVWSLIHNGVLLAIGDLHRSSLSIGWTTVIPGGGGTSSGWSFDDLDIPIPSSVRRVPSIAATNEQFLIEPDLYLHTLGIQGMHADVRSAFQEAVRCFRAELYTAAVAMLGKASEGAWLELGSALLSAHQGTEFRKQKTILEDPMLGPIKKIEAVLAIFDRQDIFRTISETAGIRPQELRSAAMWSDAVRDSRNTIHFGVEPATPNTYEKVATLLLAAVSNIRILYKLRSAAESYRTGIGIQ